MRPRRGPGPRPHRLLAVLVAAVVLAGAASAAAGAVPRQDGGPGTTEDSTTDVTPVPDQRIIPLPNSGHEPTDAGDPGGIGQALVFVGLVTALSIIVLLVRRDMRRGRRGTSAQTGRPAQSDP